MQNRRPEYAMTFERSTTMTIRTNLLPIASGVAILALVGCAPSSEPGPPPPPVEESQPAPTAAACVIESSPVPVLVHFYADGVSPAAAMADVLHGVQDDFGEALRIVEIDAEDCAALAESHGVDVIPTVVLIRPGQDDVHVMGWVSREHLDMWLATHGVTR